MSGAAGAPPPAPVEPVRIAMWSGPRNLSTALMRSFGNRPDCAVVDEPFYAPFLLISGRDHPMRSEILARHETDWRKVAAFLAGPAPSDAPLFYQKHMTHHMLPEIGREWMADCRHAFLIRHPARVLASYAAKREAVTLEDIGFTQQAELFERAAELTGGAPPVIDADALLADPGRILLLLCQALGISFSEAMLRWPAGGRATDGVWAAHWYDAVNRSTGFGAPRAPARLEPGPLRRIAEEALPYYQRLSIHALG
jgi:hypothetical protein